MKKYLIVLLLAILAVSCNKDDSDNQEEEKDLVMENLYAILGVYDATIWEAVNKEIIEGVETTITLTNDDDFLILSWLGNTFQIPITDLIYKHSYTFKDYGIVAESEYVEFEIGIYRQVSTKIGHMFIYEDKIDKYYGRYWSVNNTTAYRPQDE
ncbi:MAG: hypothetical protein LUF87_02140 [Alistipes sp.]|nr:hypothetical protein [Alistipes sp.]